MKLRIKGDSIRVRLSKSEVDELVAGSSLTESTHFGKNVFTYKVQIASTGDELTASYEQNVVTLFVPAEMISGWADNSVVGFESVMPVDDSKQMHLLLEKDFKCLDKTMEDQSDFFENPAKIC